MQLTAVFVPVPEGGFSAFVEEIPGAISEGETIEEGCENLADALRMVIKCNHEIAKQRVGAGLARLDLLRPVQGSNTDVESKFQLRSSGRQ